MLDDIVQSLMAGNSNYPGAFVAARSFWTEFYAEHSAADVTTLQAAIEKAQIPF